ncbi:hypothetical protein [Agrobacterium radiobacter]
MPVQFNKDKSALVVSETFKRHPAQTNSLRPAAELSSVSATLLEEEAPRGLVNQFLSMARTLLAGQTATLTVTTIKLDGPKLDIEEQGMQPHPDDRLHRMPGEPLAPQLVTRLLHKAWESGQLNGVSWPGYSTQVTEKLPDGTHYMALYNPSTGFLHAWTICSHTLRPKHLGWLNR